MGYDREFVLMPKDEVRALRRALRARGGETLASLLVKVAEARSGAMGWRA